MDEFHDPITPVNEINEISQINRINHMNPITSLCVAKDPLDRLRVKELCLYQERCSPRLEKYLKRSVSSEAAEIRLNPSFKDSVSVAKQNRK